MDMITDARQVAQHEAARAATQAGGEFLTFRLGAEEYGIDILRVQEIRSYEQPTRIANAPAFIKGVVNLRGVIVPIVDLRLKLGCASRRVQHLHRRHRAQRASGRVVGAVVDSVSDVLELAAGQHQARARADLRASTPASSPASAPSRTASAERMLILMDIEALMTSADMGLISDLH